MRLLVCGLLLAGFATPALAGDLDYSWLRGSAQPTADPPTYARWSGFYGGGTVSAEFHGVDFVDTAGPQLSTIFASDPVLATAPVPHTPNLPDFSSKGPGFGGFAGYGYQIDDIVLGFEGTFNRSTVTGNASSAQTSKYLLTLPGGYIYNTTIFSATSASAALAQYGIARLRAGWAVGSFLPFMTAGVSVAQINTSRTAFVSYSGVNVVTSTSTPQLPNVANSYYEADTSHGKYGFGFSVGLGLDYALLRNIFLRTETEYVQFGSPNNVKMNTIAVRAGGGVKF